MKIIIVGCGKVGETLAEELGGEGNDITVVDLSQEKVKNITERLDVMGVVGNGATHTTLKEAGIESADLLVSVTESDELNLLCCLIAKKTGNCAVIARVRSPEYRDEMDYLKNELGLAMVINPEYAAAQEIARVLRFPLATKIETFAKGRVELIKFRLPEGNRLVGCPVKDVVTKLKCNILVCTVERGDEVHVARGDLVFAGGDVVSIVASPKNAADFFKKANYKLSTIRTALVVGAGNVTHYLASLLEKTGVSLKVIERDVAKCNELAAACPELVVINGDETDRELLVEEGIETTDAFVVLSESDEENILLSVFGKKRDACKTITEIARSEYDDIVKHLDLDTVVYPKNITSDMIVRYVRSMKNTRGSNVESMYTFIMGRVEACEFIVREPLPITDVPISELKIKDDVLIAAILRGGDVIFPHGQDRICVGDAVIIISKLLGLRDISEAFK